MVFGKFIASNSEKGIECPKCNKKGGAFDCIEEIKRGGNKYYDELGLSTDRGQEEFGYIKYSTAIEMLQNCFKCSFCNHVWNFLGKKIEQEDQEYKDN